MTQLEVLKCRPKTGTTVKPHTAHPPPCRDQVFKPNDLSSVNLFSIITGDRVAEVSTFDMMLFKIKKLVRG